jgi:hypothetical protein
MSVNSPKVNPPLKAALLALSLLAAITALPAQTKAQSYGQFHEANLSQFATLDLPDAPAPQNQVPTTSQDTQQSPSEAQQPSSSSQPQQPAPPPLDEKERRRLAREAAERELQREEHQRIAGIVPNFNAVMDGSTVPLSPGQKMRASFRSAVDPYQFALAGITSAYGQATDSHSSIDPNGFRHGYGQGWIGYSKRYGASYMDQFDGTILGNGVFPVLLHQDARYFRMGTGSFTRRLLYSVSTTVRCRGDNGKWQPNVSNLLGNLASGGISNLYYPAADRGFELTIEQGLVVTAEGTFGALLIEFYPNIQHKLFPKHGPKQTPDPRAP